MERKILAAALILAGCGGSDATPPPADAGADADPDPGSLDTAAAKYPDIRTFWERSVSRTCGPNNGVCHNSRQFPDMQTASGLLDAVGKRCNQIRTEASSVDNLCEPPGDELSIGGFQARIGNITPSPLMNPTTLTVTLHDPIPPGTTGKMAVVREQQGLSPLTFPMPAAALKSATGSQVILDYAALAAADAVAPGGTLATFLDPPTFTPGDVTQVELGDPNGDGVFGADLAGALVKPGDPMKSYLFLRVIGPLALGGNEDTNMTAAPSTEPQMPIANFQYWDVDNDVTAIWCWISGMKADGSNADGPIDYTHCDLSKVPKPTHQGGEAKTFSEVYSTILSPTCNVCHHTGTTQPTTLYFDDLQETYDTLLGVRGTGPSENGLMLPYVTRSDPTKSYLYLKITGASGVSGAKMPLGAALQEAQIDSIGTWISQGANND